jgi:hypothetical protein
MLPLALLAGCALQLEGSSPNAGNRTLRIASWNLGSGADPRLEACQTREEADYASLRREIEQLGADVIAFQDIESEAVAARLFDRSRYVVIMERRRRPASPSCGSPERLMERTLGMAVRRNIPFSLHDLTALQLGDPNLPPGIEVALRPRGGRPVRILNVRLQPGCATGLTGAACASLLAQAGILERWIDSAARGPTRFILAGGWNRRIAAPSDRVWSALDDAEHLNADLTIANVTPQCGSGMESSTDHIVMDRRAAADRRTAAEQPMGLRSGSARHCPIIIEIVR